MYRNLLLATAAVMLSAVLGCTKTTYTVIADLPNPPPLPETQAAPGQPDGPAYAEGLSRKLNGGKEAGSLAELPKLPAPPPGWIPPSREEPWRYIVIHHSSTEGGNAASFDQFHREVRHWDELGYHFVICNGNGSEDGLVEIGSRWTRQKWGAHTGGTPDNEYNNFGIGICVVGDFNTHMPSPKQIESLRKLVEFLSQRYDIPPDHILGHRDAPNAHTDCPGDQLHVYLHTVLRKELARPTYAQR